MIENAPEYARFDVLFRNATIDGSIRRTTVSLLAGYTTEDDIPSIAAVAAGWNADDIVIMSKEPVMYAFGMSEDGGKTFTTYGIADFGASLAHSGRMLDAPNCTRRDLPRGRGWEVTNGKRVWRWVVEA